MQRFTPYLGIVAGLALFGLTGLFWAGKAIVQNHSSLATTTSSTPFVPAENAVSSSTPVQLAMTARETSAPRVVPSKSLQAMATSRAVSPTGRNLALDAAAPTFLNSLVNILCFGPSKGIHSITGSGVMIDPKGIILTNAHVAQHFLLADRGVTCTVRTGRPAAASYSAKLIYISPQWLKANSRSFIEEGPSGTGEYDFALLAVDSSETASPLPALFTHVPLAKMAPQPGAPVLIGSYAAQFLETDQILSNLYSTLVTGSVKDVYTFGKNTIDLLALGASAAAQSGSSGGGVVDETGKLVGTITTTSAIVGDSSTRAVDAISASYIRAEFAKETGGSLDTLLAESTATAIASFAAAAPTLEAILTAHLQ